MSEMTELERRCVDAALEARIGALADGPEGHMLSIVSAVLAEAGVAELVELATAIADGEGDPQEMARQTLAKIGANQ